MADITLDGFDLLVEHFTKLGDQAYMEEIGKAMVNEVTPAVEATVKSAVHDAEFGKYSTFSISASMQATAPKTNRLGVYSVVRPTGYDSRGVRNGFKAAILEYGVPGHQQAKPWRHYAVNKAGATAKKRMEEILKEKVELN